jgi:hypothetical protein
MKGKPDKAAIARWWLDFKRNNFADPEGVAKAAQVYAQVLFGRSKGANRAAAEYLWVWQNVKLYQDGEGAQLEPIDQLPARLFFLAPLVNALDSNDPSFFEGLAKAMRRAQ